MWAKALAAIAFVIGLWLLQRFPEALEFQRQSILSGQVWRFWTGHWVHAYTAHFFLNCAVALLLYFAFFTTIRSLELLVTGVLFSSLISGSLLLLMPELDWYNGLSGLLHAWVVYASIRKIQAGQAMYWLGVLLVWVKVSLETAGVGSWSGGMLGSLNVIEQAHLIGTLIGTFAGIAMLVLSKKNSAKYPAGK